MVRGVINKNNFYRSRFVSALYYLLGISPSRHLVYHIYKWHSIFINQIYFVEKELMHNM